MPDPFRHYEGAPLIDLPADPPHPGTSQPAAGAEFLSQLLYYSAAISATKVVPATGYRYALRVNPSSGNLHPTEFHFVTRGLRDWPDGLYHYRPSSHMAEQRALGRFDLGDAPVVFVLTSIAWREAWKYRERAYRYCLHDAGHAWQSLAMAAEAMGCMAYAEGSFDDDALAEALRLSSDEWPMLLVPVDGAIPTREPEGGDTVWTPGEPNELSAERIAYPPIDEVHAATKALVTGADEPAAPGCGEIALPQHAPALQSFGEAARTRRSALDFEGGDRGIGLDQLATLLDAAASPLECGFGGFVQLHLYAHRVAGLEPGVYRHWPGGASLETLRLGDQRVMAAGLSLGQSLAGNACVAFSMIAGLERACLVHGDRGYRYAHFEAGAIGQRLYLAAERLGLRATGIGAFFDDEVHRYLGLSPDQGQVIYHFAIGYPVHDPRLAG